MVTAAEANAMLPHSLALAGQIGSASIASTGATQRAKMDNDAKLRDLIKGKQLDRENSQAEFDQVRDAVNAAPGQHINAKMGNASYGESMVDPAVHADKMTKSEMDALKKLADKTVGSMHGQTDALETLKNALDNPSSVNDQQLQTGLARLSEGPGQRLLHTIVETAGITPTAAGGLTDVQNFIRGGGMSKLQPGQKQAIADSLSQHTGLIDQQFKDQSAIYNGQATLIAPHLSPEQHKAMFDSYATPFQGSLSRLRPPKQAVADPNVAAQATGTMGPKAGLVDKLAAFLSPNSQGAAPAAPQGPPPMSYEQWKAANDAKKAAAAAQGR